MTFTRVKVDDDEEEGGEVLGKIAAHMQHAQ